jgi:RNA pseudouridylate synthase
MSLKVTSLEDTSLEDLPPGQMSPEAMQARVLYRDGLMLVIDKPAGMPVHRGPKGGGSLEDHFGALRYGLPRPPALAHRLDKDTSGCLVLGRHRKALAHLGPLFKHGKVAKTYWAVVEGHPDEDQGVIDLPLGRLDESWGWWMKPDPKGLPSVTTWKVMGRSGAAGEAAGEGAAATSGRGPLAWLAHAGDRSHPPASGALRGARMADRRRQHLRRRAALPRPRHAAPCPRDRRADLQEQGPGADRRPGPGPHAGAARGLRMERHR